MRHLIDPLDFTYEETLRLLDLADRIHDDPAAYKDVAYRKRLASLFYEPSTRTRLSFEAAMLNLGGQVLGFPDAGVSSASKGETVADTIRIVSCYADIAAMRHPKEGAPLRAARYSRIPVINAGDGGHSHPTQTLLDMMTIRRRKGHLDGLTIGFCGDLKFGRTVHSLIKSLSRWPNMKFVLISPEELRDLMHFGLFCAALGIAALATRKRGGRSPYDPAARNLLRKQQFGHGSSPVQAVFSPSDLSLHFDQGPEPIQKLSYDCFECVIETQDLLLPVRDGRVIVLQKKDLPAGALLELREYLREQVLYMAVVPTAAHR